MYCLNKNDLSNDYKVSDLTISWSYGLRKTELKHFPGINFYFVCAFAILRLLDETVLRKYLTSRVA